MIRALSLAFFLSFVGTEVLAAKNNSKIKMPFIGLHKSCEINYVFKNKNAPFAVQVKCDGTELETNSPGQNELVTYIKLWRSHLTASRFKFEKYGVVPVSVPIRDRYITANMAKETYINSDSNKIVSSRSTSSQ